MAKKKHPFMCENCDSETMIYKHGKGHRVLVCPNCGVLATNGKRRLLKKAAKGLLRSVPVVGDVAAELITKDNSETTPLLKPRYPRHDHSLEKIKYALGGK